MAYLIFRISIKNIALFVLMMTGALYVIFNMGYAAHDGYNKEILIIYVITALLQIVINYFMYKKQITINPKLFFIVILIVVCIYSLFPLVNYLP